MESVVLLMVQPGEASVWPYGDADLRHVHLFDDFPHYLDGAGAAGHNAGAHMTKVGFGEVFVAQHGDKHGGHPVKSGDLFLIDTGKALFGGECWNGAHGGAVGHGGGHSQHHAEAVEHGHLDHHPVGGGEVHAVADGLAVVHHIVVGQHVTPLGKPVVPEVYNIHTSFLSIAAARRYTSSTGLFPKLPELLPKSSNPFGWIRR